AIQLPASTANPTAILTHIVRSALGEMLPSEKKSSMRRRKTFGNEDTHANSSTESRNEASVGTTSAISGFRLIAASPRITGAVMSGWVCIPARFAEGRLPSGGFVARHRLWRKSRKLMLARQLKEDQGYFGLLVAGAGRVLSEVIKGIKGGAPFELCKSLLT